MSDVYHHVPQSQAVWLDNVDLRAAGRVAAQGLWKAPVCAGELQNIYPARDDNEGHVVKRREPRKNRRGDTAPVWWFDPDRGETLARRPEERAQEHRLTGPVRLIRNVAQAWSLTNDELAALLAHRDSNLAADMLRGVLPLRDADREDRARLIYLIHETLADLFVDSADEGRWMRTPLRLLDGFTPLEYMIAHRIPGMVSVRGLVEQRLANR